MTSDLEQDAFLAWVDRVLIPRLLDRQVRSRVIDIALAGVSYRPDVLERQASQKEFVFPIWDYLEIAVSEERVRNGRQELRRHRALLNRIEAAFGVEPEVVAAIWGLETGYGVVKGNIPVFSALATLAYRGRRAAFFEDELVSALRIIQTKGCAPSALVGSWAGAIGHGQFMPSSVLEFAVDFDGDGLANICGPDPTDALASIAHYLKKHEWKTGQPWGLEVRLPEGFDYTLAGTDQTRPAVEWAELGVVTASGGGLPDYGSGSILLPAGVQGSAFLVLRNFHVITRYNKSEVYALAIGCLSDRLAGAKPVPGRWPTEDRLLTNDDVAEVQYLLTKAGYDTHGVDGLRGPNTTRAIRAFQQAQGLVPDGYMHVELLERLRRLIGREGEKIVRG